jgi:hypothetical protein
MMKIIKRIAELQPSYSSSNTDEMKERGVLIRRELPEALRDYLPELRPNLGKYGADLTIDASDGIGRKTEAPWVRLASKELSPSATIGFYIVIHFSRDGQRFYISVGFGSSKWDSDRGDLVRDSNEVLDRKALWALAELERVGADTSAFPDQINLGARQPLPQSFERATVLAREFSPESTSAIEIIECIKSGLQVLEILYDAYSQGASLLASEIDESEIESTVSPTRTTTAKSQGFGLSAAERRAIELRAMNVTKDFLVEKGYSVTDTSARKSFDFLAEKAEDWIKVEVKGTTANEADSVLMTQNEVSLHRKEKGNTALAIVSGIVLTKRGSEAAADGGELEFIFPWDIDAWSLSPIAYKVFR